jgi:hypothetical protein
VPVTVSAGVGEVPGNAGDCEQLVAAADTALYAAKREGRNRSVRSDRVAEPRELPPHPSLLRPTLGRGRGTDRPVPGVRPEATDGAGRFVTDRG